MENWTLQHLNKNVLIKMLEEKENNWNELKEWLEDKRKFSECGRTCISGMTFIGQNEQVYTGVINKIQEIESLSPKAIGEKHEQN